MSPWKSLHFNFFNFLGRHVLNEGVFLFLWVCGGWGCLEHTQKWSSVKEKESDDLLPVGSSGGDSSGSLTWPRVSCGSWTRQVWLCAHFEGEKVRLMPDGQLTLDSSASKSCWNPWEWVPWPHWGTNFPQGTLPSSVRTKTNLTHVWVFRIAQGDPLRRQTCALSRWRRGEGSVWWDKGARALIAKESWEGRPLPVCSPLLASEGGHCGHLLEKPQTRRIGSSSQQGFIGEKSH